MVVDDGRCLVVDDRLHEFVLVGEVVVELRSADLGRRLDVVKGGACDAELVDQPSGLVDDPCPGPLPLAVSLGRSGASLAMRACYIILGLTTQFVALEWVA